MAHLTDALVQLIEQGKIDDAISAVQKELHTCSIDERAHYLNDYFYDIYLKIFSTETSPSREQLSNWMAFTHQCSPYVTYDITKNECSLSHTIYKIILHQLNILKNEPFNVICVLAYFFKYHGYTVSDLTEIEPDKNFNQNIFFTLLDALIHMDLLTSNAIQELMVYSIEQYNQPLFNKLKNISDRLALPALNLSDRLLVKQNILTRCPPDIAHHLNNITRQLTPRFGYMAHDSSTAATFILAAIKHDKRDPYCFLPTLISIGPRPEVDTHEFERYLRSIATMQRPVRERFLLAGGHWMSGEIEINEQGDVHLLILDSLGEKCTFITKKMNINHIFQDQFIHIYQTNDRRQYGHLWCYAFALDDVRHFYTIDRYASEKKTLFEQLNERIEPSKTIINGKTTLYSCKLPPLLIRTMQSRTLFDQIEPYKDLRVAKAQKTITTSVRDYFLFNASAEPEKNKRIDAKREKMAQRMVNFIDECLNDDPAQGYRQLCALANEHTLSAFEERVALSHQINVLKNP